MKPIADAEVERIFHEVADLGPADRYQRLRRLCDDDAKRRAVEALLEQDASGPCFLDEPVFGERLRLDDCIDVTEELVGKRIGAYELVEHVATGGMGIVFKARRADEQFEKTVAVKLLRKSLDDSAFRRFRRERQTLADLEHPNIARLLDAGVADNATPFLVMEFVEGEPITSFCRRTSATLAERLKHFETICRAVEYSHAKLVVHRDLKPENIFITADGTVKLLDFGVAKVLDESRDEPVGGPVAYTPRYASPEQIRGEPVTAATDVYSLGLVLYELLSDRPAIDEEDDATAADPDRREREIVPPSRHASSGFARKVRGDLDAIVMRAVRARPRDRYQSVEKLLADLERYRAHRPVLARPRTWWYRLAKSLRRNRLGLVIGACLAASVATGVFATMQKSREVERERDTVTEALRFLDDILSSAQPGLDYSVAEAVTSAAKRMEFELQDKPRVRAAIHTTIARAFLGLGRYEQAERHFESAIDEATTIYGPRAPIVLERKGELAVVLHATSRMEEARELLEVGLADCIAQLGAADLLTAQYQNNLAAVLARLGQLDEATTLYRKALETRERRLGPMDLTIAETRNNLSGIAKKRGDSAEAVEHARAALKIRRTRLAGGHPLVLQSLTNVAIMLCERGDPESIREAESLLVESAERARLTFTKGHPDLGAPIGALGALYLATDRATEAEPLLAEAFRIYQRHLSRDHPRAARVATQLAWCWIRLGKNGRAERLLLQTERALRNKPGERRTLHGQVRSLLVTLYERLKRPDDADRWRGESRE